MNLLQLLLSTLTTQSSVNTVSKKTGVNSKLTSKLLLVAIPLLIKYMTKNASKKPGAQSLLSALGQHTNTQTMTQQLQNADQNDGSRIINHILGKDKDTVVNSLASETGLNSNQVNSTLSTIAPALLSGLSAATTQAQNQSSGVNLSDGLDFGDLMALFGGSNNNASSSLLGSLLGGSTQQQTQQSNGMGNILGALLGSGTTQQQTQQSSGSDLTGLLTSLLGAGTTQTTTSKKKKTQQSQLDGTDLLQLLTALSK
ncbi:MAG: DUF937 domain-containing protein [Erysipelotrichaceae bacterium]|nr:DUF937 domain-containing protein [Erysipelotrichaceae bacterium]